MRVGWWGRRAPLATATVLLFGGLSACSPQTREPTPIPVAPDYARRLALAQADVAAAESATRLAPDVADNAIAWIEALLELAWLTGDYAQFAAADRVAEIAQAATGQSPNLCTTLARLHVALHRLTEADAALVACTRLADPQVRARIEADLLFMRGELSAALTQIRARLNARPTASHLVQMATIQEATGAPEEAKALYRAAEAADHSLDPAQQAWLKLRRGHVALHQGRWEEARAIYLAADAALPGWWLIEEHLAEIEALLGDTATAEQRYHDIVNRTGLPEFMDALAALAADAGRNAEARQWQTRARTAYEARLSEFPEAAAGHALDHFLSFDPPRALQLARDNFALRPYLAPALGLVRALVLADDLRAALPLLQQQHDAGWRSAELYWVWSELLIAAGQRPADALGFREAALALNPRAAQMYAVDFPH